MPSHHSAVAYLKVAIPTSAWLLTQAMCVRAQEEVDLAFSDKKRWAKMAIINTAMMGKFSSDRTISQYAEQIWKLKPVKIGE